MTISQKEYQIANKVQYIATYDNNLQGTAKKGLKFCQRGQFF